MAAVIEVGIVKRRGLVPLSSSARGRGHADRFWALALACQKERADFQSNACEIGVTII